MSSLEALKHIEKNSLIYTDIDYREKGTEHVYTYRMCEYAIDAAKEANKWIERNRERLELFGLKRYIRDQKTQQLIRI